MNLIILDERFPLPKYVIPGTGTFVSCVETSAERKAIVMGKPTNMICDIFFKESSKETPKKFLMIGDRLNTDILFGKRHLFQTLFVESGVHKISDIEKIIHTLEGGTVDQDLDDQIPDYYIKELGDLLEYMV